MGLGELNKQQLGLIRQGVLGYYSSLRKMISGYMDFTRKYGVVDDRVANYAREVCDVVDKLTLWVINYARKLLSTEVTYSDAREFVIEVISEAEKAPAIRREISEVVSLCEKLKETKKF